MQAGKPRFKVGQVLAITIDRIEPKYILVEAIRKVDGVFSYKEVKATSVVEWPESHLRALTKKEMGI